MPLVSAPLQTPTANAGSHAQAVLLAAQALQVMQKAISMVDPTTALGHALARALADLGKQVGSPPEEQQINSLKSQLLEAQRSVMQRQAMQQMAVQHAMGGGAAPQGGAAAAAPPMAA